VTVPTRVNLSQTAAPIPTVKYLCRPRREPGCGHRIRKLRSEADVERAANHPSRTHDDADGRLLRRVRARYDPRTHLRRPRRRPGRGRVGGRRKKLDAAKRREIAESVITGRKSGAEMARLYNISQPTVSRIVAQHRMATP
jgi:hypothetical protein